MLNATWMDLMNISSSKPNISNCPKILSNQAKDLWIDLVNNNDKTIASLPHEKSWQYVLLKLYDLTLQNNIDWINPALDGPPALNALRLDVKSKRALMVVITDTTGVLKNLNITNIEKNIDLIDGILVLTTRATCELDNSITEDEWFSKLSKNRFKLFGYRYRIFGLPKGTSTVIEKHPFHKITFKSKIAVPCTYIPPDSVLPLIQPQVFAKAIMEDIWNPAVVSFKYKTTKRRTSIL